MEDLVGLEIELGDAVEYPLAGPEWNGDDVEPELVDDARLQRAASFGSGFLVSLVVCRRLNWSSTCFVR